MNIFKKARKDLDITQEEMAVLLGVTKQAVCNYEKGIRMPNPKKNNTSC